VGDVSLLLVSGAYHPVYAGPAVRFRGYVPGFRDRGIDVSVVAGTPTLQKGRMFGADPDWYEARPGTALPVEVVDGVRVRRVRLPDRNSFRRDALLGRYVVEVCERGDTCPDVIQFLTLDLASIPSLRTLRRMAVPTVFTVTMVSEPPGNPLKRRIVHLRNIEPLRHIDRVVVSSSFMRENLERWGVSREVEVIPNGVDVGRFRPAESFTEREAVRRQWGARPDEIVALFVGPISERKGVDLLLGAWKTIAAGLPDVRLVLVGPRHDISDPSKRAFHQELMSLIDASGAPDRVHFAGLATNVDEQMRGADMFVFTSRREGMPNVILEAMATGLPVITTPFIGLPAEFGIPGRHFRLVEAEPAVLGAAVEDFARSEKMRTEFGRAAREWAESRMRVELSLDRYADLYRGLKEHGAS
jgi:glycosyltransferase involved in cell wall biosynthesis